MNAQEIAYIEELKNHNLSLVEKTEELTNQNLSLVEKTEELTNQNLSLAEKTEELKNKNYTLQEQLEWLKRQVFGSRSEREVPENPNQLTLDIFGELKPFPEEEEKEQAPPKKKSKKKKKGSDTVTLPDDLPVEKTIIDVSEEEKTCPETGKSFVKIGEEVSSKLAHKPGSYFVKQIIRPKYALPQGEGIVCADLPDSLLYRCQADESLLAEILVRKFGDHLPLYRQSEISGREDVQISRQLLSQWTLRASLALEPLYEELIKTILETGNIFIDESPVSVLAPGKGKTKKGYMWVIASNTLSAFAFRESRQHIHAENLLNDFKGFFHSDKYQAYENLAKEFDQDLIWCPCWAHIRRKFFEATTGDPSFRKWMLRHIRYLFWFERIAWERPPDERLRIRQEKEVPLIDKMIDACKNRISQGKLLPSSKLSKALGYFTGLIPYLKNYIRHTEARLDNNTAERIIRPLAIGRKNWMFAGSSRGGKAAAIALSLVQSCRGLNVNPREYLEDVMRRIMSHPSNKLRELLPDIWNAEKGRSVHP